MLTKYDDNNREASVKRNKALHITYDTLFKCTSLHEAIHSGNPIAQHK
jgi:hypothetical protein